MVITDLKPLTHTFLASSDKYTLRQVRHLDYILQFTLNIHHVHRTQKQSANVLSCIRVNALATGTFNQMNFLEMAAAQTKDLKLQ